MDYKLYKAKRKIYSKWPGYKEQVVWLRKYQLGLCFICLLPLADKVHIDHIKPLYGGGTNSQKNMALTHPRCNILKGVSVILGPKEIKWRRDKLTEIKEGIEFYKRQDRGIKPKPNQEVRIAVAVDYLGLDYFKHKS
jgi:5-methylcytosine-specific restriction endonuclease McrA